MAPVTVQAPAFEADPVEAFWAPGRDVGLSLLSDPGAAWTSVKGGTIRAVGLSDHAEINQRWFDERLRVAERFMASSVVEFATAPALATDVSIRQNTLAVNGKWLLAGPAGDRMIAHCQHAWRKADKRPFWGKRLRAHLEDAPSGMPQVTGEDVRDVPFVIEAKNLKNYYHFTKEVLAALTALDAVPGHRASIKIVYQKHPPAPFVPRFIEALFPELAARVEYVEAPQSFPKAILCWYGDYAELQGPRSGHWGARHAFETTPTGAGISMILRHCGYARALRLLRERAFRAIEGQDFSHLPRRFWVTRIGGHDRAPRMEAAIIAAFAERGFQTLAFEELSPLEQIAAMARAQAMASYHGAGFTNMMYAARAAKVIELGTLQTGIQRVGDFSAFAHVSGCDYTHAAADFDHTGPEVIPPLRGNGLYPVRISDAGIARLMSHVDGLLGPVAKD
ncbi:MAG: glycosyltransferase 61 family protein [Pseudomonadota bacterium]